MTWWQSFFDATYVELWGHANPPEQSAAEADILVELLQLEAGARVLDAPCGYGRSSIALARKGMQVTGVDYSPALLAHASECARDQELAGSLAWREHDLREPLGLRDFDAAISLFSSLGYGSEEDDERVLRTSAACLRPGGRFFVDTMHRDAYVIRRDRGERYGLRATDGLTLRETNRFDPIEGRLYSTWTWNSPTRSGSRSSNMRLYCITELLALLQRSGLEPISCHQGISPKRFEEAPADARLGILCRKTGPQGSWNGF